MKVLIFSILSVLIFSDNAFAYIDPGTGSFVIQMLIAGILGAVFTIKMWIGSARAFVMKLIGRSPNQDFSKDESEENDSSSA
ncbi:hypothetical protein ACFL6N_05830 [Thermodesulfobacteriota bacterium]